MHDRRLVDNSLNAWQPLTKALEKEQELLKMVIRIGSISEAWRALTKIANASEEVECDRAKREFETLEMDASESVAEFFTRVHIILMELERHQNIPIPAREIQRVVLGSLSPRFPNEMSMNAYKGECDLKDLETGLARVEKFRLDQIKKGASPHALAVAYAGSGGAGTGGGTRGRGKRSGRRSGKRQDDGRDEQQQQQQQQSPPWAAAVTPMAAATDTRMAPAPAAVTRMAPAAATVTCTAAAAAAAAAISTAATTAAKTTPTAVQPVGQLGEPARSTAVPERSAPSKEKTASGKRTAALAACRVSAVRRG